VLQGTSTPTDHSVEFSYGLNTIHYASANVINRTLTINSTADCNVTIRSYDFQVVQIEAVVGLRTSGNLKGNQLAIKTSGTCRIILYNITYE